MAGVQRGSGPVELTVEQHGLQALARALKTESDGKALRRDLVKGLRSNMEPVRQEARSNLMGISSAGLNHGESLRTAVAAKLRAEVRLSGRSTGVRLRVRRKGMPRGFANAPKALNTPKGWRHRVYGRDVWVKQVARPTEWFDKATRTRRKQLRQAVTTAMEQMADRIARRGPFE